MERTGRGVLVLGVDASDVGDAALRHAFAEAVLRGASLRVVVACPPAPPRVPEDEQLPVPDAGTDRRALAELVRRHVADVRRLVPGAEAVEVEVLARTGSPVDVLLSAARGADLLVVGHRGRGARQGGSPGSVEIGVVLRARCPVTVVPVHVPEPPGTAFYETSPGPLPVGPIARTAP